MTTETRASYCRICPALCGVLVEVQDGVRIRSVRGDPDHPLSRGYTCAKGRALGDEHHADDRLTTTLRRVADGTFAPVEPDAAISEIAAQVSSIIEQHGPRSVGLYVGTRGYEVLPLAAATAWLRGIGSPMFFSTYTIDQPGKDLARAIHGSWTAGLQPVVGSDVVMLVGNNPFVSGFAAYTAFPVTNPRVELRRLKEAGLKVVVMDPRRTETAAWADIHLQPRPGEDPVVLAGMIRRIMAAGTHDAEFVSAHTQGFEQLRTAVEPFDPAFVQARAGIAPDDLVAAADTFALASRGSAIGGTGINMSPHGTLSEYLLLCLNSLCGRYVRAGEIVANPGVLTSGRPPVARVRGPRSIAGSGPQPRVRGLSTLYDQMPSAALAEEITTPGPGRLRALIVSGGNPLVALPDLDATRDAFGELELLVCLDVRLSQTARLADYVIGCKLSLEKADSTLGSDLRFHRPFAQYAPPVVEPAPGLLDEWEFFWTLAREMSTPWDLTGRVGLPIPLDLADDIVGGGRPTTEDLWDLLCRGARIPLDEIRAHVHGLAPALDAVSVRAADGDDLLELADPLMLGELSTMSGEAPVGDEAFPLRLISRRMASFHNSWGQNIPSLRKTRATPPAYANPEDLAAAGLRSGDRARIESPHGATTARIEAAEDLPRGVVSMTHCWGDLDGESNPEQGPAASRLTSAHDTSDGLVGMPRQSAIPVRLARADVSDSLPVPDAP